MKRDQRKRRRYLGGTCVPFAWHVGGGGSLEKAPEEQAVIR